MKLTASQKASKSLVIIGRALDLWLPFKVQYDHTPGTSVAIYHKGKPVYERGFGYADVERRIKATDKTRYRVASMSKMFTAVAILQLQEKKKLKLSAPVSKYLPWFKGKNKVGDLSKITIQQILSHSSGLIRDGHTNQWENNNFPKSLKKDMGPDSIIFKSPAKFKYSNHAYSLLGEVIKEVSDISYNEYVQKFIIKPLGLRNTFPDLTPQSSKNLAKGYSREIPGRKMSAFKHMSTHAYSPATGFISTASDIAAFLSFLSSTAFPKILSPKSKKLMIRTPINTGDGSYGLGLDIDKVAKRQLIGHGGGFPGFVTQAKMDPADQLMVVVLSNRVWANSHGITVSIFKFFFFLMDHLLAFPRIRNPLQYEGVYRNRVGDSLIVGLSTCLLRLSAASNFPSKPALLITKGNGTFVIKEDDRFHSLGEQVKFTNFKKGKPQRFVVGGTVNKRVI